MYNNLLKLKVNIAVQTIDDTIASFNDRMASFNEPELKEKAKGIINNINIYKNELIRLTKQYNEAAQKNDEALANELDGKIDELCNEFSEYTDKVAITFVNEINEKSVTNGVMVKELDKLIDAIPDTKKKVTETANSIGDKILCEKVAKWANQLDLYKGRSIKLKEECKIAAENNNVELIQKINEREQSLEEELSKLLDGETQELLIELSNATEKKAEIENAIKQVRKEYNGLIKNINTAIGNIEKLIRKNHNRAVKEKGDEIIYKLKVYKREFAKLTEQIEKSIREEDSEQTDNLIKKFTAYAGQVNKICDKDGDELVRIANSRRGWF